MQYLIFECGYYFSTEVFIAIYFSFFSVAGIQSENIVEFDIIDFIGCFTLKSLIDEMELTIGYPQLLAVKDRSESSAGDEATIALILVLEEWLDQ
jgi:hypothetical protein